MSEIAGHEYQLLKIFSSDFEYHIPAYQRPYAWTEEETGTLFDDLYSFYVSEQEDENYFLGSIVLIKENIDRKADVIDGQQRLTTLTILFSVLANCLTDIDDKASCMEILQEKGNKLAGIASQPRLFLREWDQDFFNKYIQNVKLDELLKLDAANLDTEAKKHIQTNCRVLLNRFNDTFQGNENELLKFSNFLLNRCYLVAVSTPSQASAFRVFSVMNSRGLNLLPTDIIKSETIGKLPVELQQEYTDKWEELENEAGRDGFNEVFTHTRTIFTMERAKKNLLDEFRSYVIPETTPKSLIDDYLEPYTMAYMKLKNCAYTSSKNAEEINNYLYWLNKNNNYDWMPLAILFMTYYPEDHDYLLWFVKKLERIASYLQVTAQDVNHRMARYKFILAEMKERPDSSLDNPLKNIELTEWEKEEFLRTLNGDIYTMPATRRNYIIQRLDSFVSDGGAIYNTKLFTIEHVLPQNPSSESEWFNLWSDTKLRQYWLNKIANLVPLTRQRNSAAQNYEFDIKKTKYFSTKNGTTSYSLTTQVINIDKWSPEVVKERQDYLMEVFTNNWELQKNPGNNEREKFILSGRGGSASGYPLDEDNFVVLAGSKISKDVTEGFPQGYSDLRDSLISDETISNGVFKKDYTFTSSSAAAAVVLGRSANGRKEWTLLDGRTYGKYGQLN
ncbi:protein of unknown function [Lachnospiraceae bacterium C7]|nr:protein of unknown function [Lachnospiraceae bacterium C7]